MAVFIACVAFAVGGFWLFRTFSGKKTIVFSTLDQKHIFITGASSGIGLALAKQALLEGAFVTVNGRNSTKLNQAVDELVKDTNCSREKVFVQVADVSHCEAITSAVQESFKWRPIDVLICNAGITRGGYFDDVPIEDQAMIVKTNLMGTMYPIHAVIPLMKQRSNSHPSSVAIIGSVASLFVLYGNCAYTATKYALKGIAECLRLELLPYNIYVNLVCPGFVRTPFLDDAEKDDELMELLNKINLYNRSHADTPENVARCTLEATKGGAFLASSSPLFPLLVTLGRGFTPPSSFLGTLLEAIGFFFLRIFTFKLEADMRKEIFKAHKSKRKEILK